MSSQFNKVIIEIIGKDNRAESSNAPLLIALNMEVERNPNDKLISFEFVLCAAVTASYTTSWARE